MTAVQVVVNTPLSTITDQGWSDDLYVTFQSSVGPDIVEIIKYLIADYSTWTGTPRPSITFRKNSKTFPANFPLLDRKNTLEVLQEIAFQARCAFGSTMACST